ncbi:MAG: hypothetical protein GYA55_00310 [SAR324 cluster bacterium]|uniref:Uncharacterized protein n=1 Tax=SAR324 cluster bacterium TaxID=2024889 RepID=A0A7X9IIZ4_9DELT|nr:hypothetical protein [SAR324 cluster bacterium]
MSIEATSGSRPVVITPPKNSEETTKPRENQADETRQSQAPESQPKESGSNNKLDEVA